MSGSISFPNIPPNLKIPLFWVDFDNSQAGLSTPIQPTVIIAQTITAAPAVLAPVISPEQANNDFGPNSHLANMIAAYRANDPLGELWCVPLADASGATAATGSIVVTGPATGNGTLAFLLGTTAVPVGVSSGDTATAIGTAIAAAINAIPELPMTASAASGTVTLTADNKGTVGNAIPILLNYRGAQQGERTPPGVTVAITAMSGGATDPSLSGIDAILGDEAFDFIIHPYAGATPLGFTTAMMNDSAGRWSYLKQLYGHVFTAKSDTVANLITLGGTVNDQHLTVWGVTQGVPTPDMIAAAARTAAVAVALRADPARPVHTLAVQGELAAPAGQRWTRANEQSLASHGISLVRGDATGVRVLKGITTYQKNSFSQPDDSYYLIQTMFTLAAITRRLRAAVESKFARAKLADDGTRFGAGQPVVTPKSILAEIVAEYAGMERDGLVQRADLMTKATIVTRNATNPNRVDVLWAPYLVGPLEIFAVLNQFRLSTAA